MLSSIPFSFFFFFLVKYMSPFIFQQPDIPLYHIKFFFFFFFFFFFQSVYLSNHYFRLVRPNHKDDLLLLSREGKRLPYKWSTIVNLPS